VLAALLPRQFLEEHGGVVVENHLNVVRPLPDAPVSPGTIAALLNTSVVDRLFRCISGSVAVSAFELNAVPLPALVKLRELERLVESGASMALIDRRVAGWYGVSWDN
jgi:adenine-specific DNA-methyltransferase